MYDEYYKVTYRRKDYKHQERPFMIQFWNDEELEKFKKYAEIDGIYYDIKVYKVLETYELLEEIY